MASSNFIDHVKFCARSGAGGAGSAHFRREKHVPKGGPDGGDGGRGGNIVLEGNQQLWTLLHLRYKKHVIAGNGAPGAGSGKSGAQGSDVVLQVPLGTVAKSADTGAIITEVTEPGKLEVINSGGRGGLGNTHFKSSTNQSPRYAQPGEPGKEEWVILELKLLADVGLVGFPNAGKSTLLSTITAAKPEIADYPFTTLVPNLGVVAYRDHRSFVMADIPGIIQGASEGKGLGLRFLRHIERNSVLLFTVPADSPNIENEFMVLLQELQRYNPELLDKKRLLAITKSDLLDEELQSEITEELKLPLPYVFISSVSNQGLDQLKDLIWRVLH